MSTYGLIGLLVAFFGVVVSVVCLFIGHLLRKRPEGPGEGFVWAGHVATILTTVALTFCCGLLVFCFMTGNTSILYVVQNQSDSSSGLAWLYKLSGLWAGREGSLLFWAWLISVFNTVVAVRNMKALEKLDNAALFVAQLVLGGFVGVLLFSESNMPFTATGAEYLNSSGQLIGSATLWGMNVLLEHWAMAVHPPALFIGYAGMTIPFAYAVAALIVGDPSKAWVEKCLRITIFSWLFLGLGIGLGALWAYVVLGWGGYWGWDPVENASLLPWLVGVALIHSLTVYRQRGAFKRWAVMCACIAFAFVILGTFITRTGIVQSVHTFDDDFVSATLFLTLIGASLVAGIVGLIVRWKRFGADTRGGDEFESLASKEVAYFVNNLVMILAALMLTYLTLASVIPVLVSLPFPPWVFPPLARQVVTAGTYNAVARLLGIFYLFVLAVCPLLAWGKTEGKRFWKHARVPGICALVLFAVLMVYFFSYLLPGYNAIIAGGGTAAEGLQEEGPAFYYNGLAVVGFFVASLLFFNSLFMLGRGIRAYAKGHGTNVVRAALGAVRNHASTYGGFISHLAMSVILIGLIGSSMYVTEKVGHMAYDPNTDSSSDQFVIRDYVLKYKDSSLEPQENGTDFLNIIRFDVYKDDAYLTTVAPSGLVVTKTNQQKLMAGIVSLPTEDLFVVYHGKDENNDLTLDVRVNPLISFVWGGFGLLMVGAVIAAVGRRKAGGPSADGGPVADAQGKEKAEKA